MLGACVPGHMVRPAAAIILDGRERSDVETTSRRRHARRKPASTAACASRASRVFYGFIQTHARDMSKVSAVLSKRWWVGAESGGGAYARSIFDWSLVGGGLGIRLGCGRCHRRSIIAWRRRWVVRERLRIRGLVCGSCSIAASVMHRYGGRRKLTNSSPSWKRHAVIQSSMVPLCNNPFFVPLSEAAGTVKTRTKTRTLLDPAYYGYAW